MEEETNGYSSVNDTTSDIATTSNQHNLPSSITNNTTNNNEITHPTPSNNHKPTYTNYVHQYCLHYIRRFFNHHLDDPWFRQRYSPLEYRRRVLTERTRAIQEAWAIQHEVDASCNVWLELQQELRGRSGGGGSGGTNGSSGATSNGNGGGGENGNGKEKDALFASLSRNRIDAPSFVLRARLGGGTKPPSSSLSSSSSLHPGGKPYPSHSNKRKFSSIDGRRTGDDGTIMSSTSTLTPLLDVDAVDTSVPHLEDGTNTIPESHVVSLVRQNSAVTIVDVPPYVTDAQIVESLREHCENEDAVGGGGSGGTNGNPVLEVYSTPVAGVVGCVEGMEPDDHRLGITSTSRNPSSSSIPASSMSSSNNTTTTTSSSSSSPTLYYRTVWAIMENEAVRDKLLENLARSNDTMRDPHDHHSHHHSSSHHHHHHHHHHSSSHHFRGGGGSGSSPSSSSTPSALQMDVDCSDPFGRCEIDADGRGGQPPPPESPTHSDTETSVSNRNDPGNLTNNNNSSSPPKVPQRFASVFVLTKAAAQMQPIGVLSAAVSSCKRIRSDRDAAIRIARDMDVWRGIPVGARLETVLEKLFPDENGGDGSMSGGMEKEDGEVDAKKKKKQQQRVEDILDVSIAYLRRVHLFTFYNGCSSSDNVGSVLSGDHPAGTIHLRLKGADEILKKTKEEHADMYDDLPMMNNSNGDKDDSKTKQEDGEEDSLPRQNQGENDESTNASSEAKDMLVMRLDANIARALGSEKDGGSSEQSPYVVNQRVDAMADEIEALEEKSKNEWIDKHAVIDSDGRARCSFHFCRKLFKDRNFLKKHLLKKHPEFLRAECAKCHDSYMMKWWDSEAKRPLPRILVDCGQSFGMMPSVVDGAAEPSAMDPEPDLWREEQERIQRRQEEEENYRHHQQIAAAEIAERNYKSGGDGRRGNGGGGSAPPQQGHDAYGGGEGGSGARSGTDFVDVDDMKDEKVELSFDNVIPAATKKKKKKKKKKLL